MHLPFTSALLPKGTQRLYLLCIHLAIGASIWGYNIGVLSSILVHPGWRAALGGHVSPSTKGLVTGIYYLGTLASYVLVAHPLADRLGRRRAAMLGTGVLSGGAVMMALAEGEAAMGIMVWGSEVSPAKERGKFVTLNHVGFIAGLAAGLWVGYGMTFWTSSETGKYWGWRLSILMQLVPAIIFVTGLPFLPDSPRWLIQQGQTERASHVLRSLRQGTMAPSLITQELDAISAAVESSPLSQSHSQGFLAPSLSLFRDPSLWARLWRAFLLQFMAQMCGAAAMKYYLPTLLKALGLEYRLALMAGAVEMTTKIGMTVMEMWLIDRFGRTRCLTAGSMMMGIAMMINGLLPLLYPGNVNKLADAICIAFIFIYAMGYSLGLGPAAWVYSAEIFPTSLRARGLNFAASGGSMGSILVSQIWPIIWFLYPETKGLALEDMNTLFGTTRRTPTHGHAESEPDTINRHNGETRLMQDADADADAESQRHGERQPLLS
ncbi:hypothetical protein E4U55_003722 [Claviceps digitariae]|nr:hypothetical protein E4U55_003722 [Claviceps digitariae]